MKIRYFAWVRERVGKTDEEVDVPANINTVGDLIGWLNADDIYEPGALAAVAAALEASPEADKKEKGKLEDSRWFDTKRLSVTSKKPAMAVPSGPRSTRARIARVAVALDGCGVPVRSLTLRTPTLDDVFLHVTGSHFAADTTTSTTTGQEAES